MGLFGEGEGRFVAEFAGVGEGLVAFEEEEPGVGAQERLLFLGEDGIGKLCVAYLLAVGLLLHKGQNLRAGEVFRDLFLDVLLEDQLAIALGVCWLVLVSLFALLFLLLLLLFLFFFLLLLLLLLFLFVLVLLGGISLLGWLLFVGGLLDGLIRLVGLVEIGVDGPLISLLEGCLGLIALLEGWLLLLILEVARLIKVASLLRLVKVASLRLIKVCIGLVEVGIGLLVVALNGLLIVSASCGLIVASG